MSLLLKLNKNQKSVANGNILAVSLSDKNLSLKESVQRLNDPIMNEAYEILTKSAKMARDLGLKGKERSAYMLDIRTNIQDSNVLKMYNRMNDVYFLNTMKESMFVLGTMQFNVSEDGTENVLTFKQKFYFNTGKLFQERTLAQFVIGANFDKFTSMDSLTELTDSVWNTVVKIASEFNENRTKYDSLEQVINQASEIITQSTAKKQAVREAINKYDF